MLVFNFEPIREQQTRNDIAIPNKLDSIASLPASMKDVDSSNFNKIYYGEALYNPYSGEYGDRDYYLQDPNSGTVYSKVTSSYENTWGEFLPVDQLVKVVATKEAMDNPDIKNLTNTYNWRGLEYFGQKYTDPAYAQQFYDLKKASPDQYYAQLATDLGNQIAGNIAMNKSEHNAAFNNQLAEIKSIAPSAYYTAQLDMLGESVGWQIGQNRSDRNGPTIAKIKSLVPEAMAAGLSADQINSIVGNGVNAANAQNQIRIANEAASGGGGFNFAKDILPGIVFVGAASLAFVTAGSSLAATAPAGAAGAGGLTAASVPTLTAGLELGAAGAGAAATGAGATGLGLTAASVGSAGLGLTAASVPTLAAGLELGTAATSSLYAAASTVGMGAIKGAGMSALTDVLSGQDINFEKALTSAAIGGVSAGVGSYAGSAAAPYGAFASKTAGAIAGSTAGGITGSILKGKDAGQGALYGFVAGLSSIPTVGIENAGGRILTNAAVGGVKSAIFGGDPLTGATMSGIGSGVSEAVNYGYNAASNAFTGKGDSQADAEFAAAQAESLRGQPGGVSDEYMAKILTQEGMDPFTALDTSRLTNQGIGEAAVAQNIAASYSPDEIYTPPAASADSALEKAAKSTLSGAITKTILSSIYQPSTAGRTLTKTTTRTAQPTSSSSDSYDPAQVSALDGTYSNTSRITPALQDSKYELRRFVSPNGKTSIRIPFKDNQPESPIPPGYKQVEVIGAAEGGLISTNMVKYSKKPLVAKRKPDVTKEKKTPRKGLAGKQSK